MGESGHRHNDGGVTVAVRLRPLFGAEREGGASEVSSLQQNAPFCLGDIAPIGRGTGPTFLSRPPLLILDAVMYTAFV